MNASQPNPEDREVLARLLPEPVERDLPSDRHRRLREFVMTEIDQDLRSDEQAPRRASRRRTVLLASAGTALAAAAAAVVVVTGAGGGAERPERGPVASASPSGRQVLLVAATTALKRPAASGKYWYVSWAYTPRQGETGTLTENWTARDGRFWEKGRATGGKVVEHTGPAPFTVGGSPLTIAQIERLPTTPDALKAWIATDQRKIPLVIRGKGTVAESRRRWVFDGLLSLVTQVPAPPKVRAAAFRALADYPNVESLGPVNGGLGLSISFDVGGRSKLVIDPETSRITSSDFVVSADGALVTAPGGATITAGWTDRAPG
ncbi:CU044_5270 family protein [Actinomadura sp. WMMA1423]|uniref:CU044_5270 family protein n=1 Tax=Actinomadura sp. WMMA1423 TaxID=2591108 RepID=UPI00114624BA|nr:CU044_5270 family protein [Actinomadura sp. WMMA1423]